MKLLKKKKGFTLVELIVVLVILAILLAILVPALTGWIDKSREKQALINGRTVYLAVQTLEDEAYGRNTNYAAHDGPDTGATPTYVTSDAVADLADLTIGTENALSWTASATGKITAFSYTEKGFVVSIGTDGVLEVNKAP